MFINIPENGFYFDADRIKYLEKKYLQSVDTFDTSAGNLNAFLSPTGPCPYL